MAVHSSVQITIAINVPPGRAYEFLEDPANLPRWASGLGDSIRQLEASEWLAETPAGPMRIRFSPHNRFGVLDHWVLPDSGDAIYIPMRVVANGDGCEVMLTLFRRPGMTDEEFARDADWVRRDLRALQALLEG